jgi:nucleoside-diphosphate-sugar epimerase
MKAFVTGGTGFIGRNLVKRLIALGHELVCLARKTSDISGLKKPGIEIVIGDVSEKESMVGAISKCDVVYHLAAWYEFGVWNKRRMFETNVVGTQNVLKLAMDKGKKVVFCSTAGVLGYSNGAPQREDSKRPDEFTSEYERTKYLAHREAQRFADNGLDVVIPMPGAVFGPGDTSLVGRIVEQYVRGKLKYFIKVSPKFSWVHVDDVVNGIVLIEEKGRRGESYVLSDTHMDINEFIKRAEGVTGIPGPKRRFSVGAVKLLAPFSEVYSKMRRRKALLSREAVRMLQHDWTWDSSKVRNELGWNPLDFDERFKDTLDWYVSRNGSP